MNKSATIGWLATVASEGALMHASEQERSVKLEQIAADKDYSSAEEWRKNRKCDYVMTSAGLYLKDSMINGMVSLTIGAGVEGIAKHIFKEL